MDPFLSLFLIFVQEGGRPAGLGGGATGSDSIHRNVGSGLSPFLTVLFPYRGFTGFVGSAVTHLCHFQPRQLTSKQLIVCVCVLKGVGWDRC